MKISSINPSFQGRRDNIDAMINADDNSIRKVAFVKTAIDTNYDKKRKIANAVMYSAPIAAGLSHMALTQTKQAKIFSKQVQGFAAKAANGLKVGGIWAAGLAGLGIMNSALRSLRENSKTYRNFDNKNQLASSFATVTAGFGVLAAVERGALALANVKAPEFMQNATLKAAKFLNKNKTINNVRSFAAESFSKLPKWAKNTSKFAALWSPEALLLSGIIYGIKTNNKAQKEFHKNYADMKAEQSRLAQARVRELKVQNDFLMQDEQNREDIALLKHPDIGLEEVLG